MTNWNGHSQRGLNPVFLVLCLELGMWVNRAQSQLPIYRRWHKLRRKGPLRWWTGSHGNKRYPVLYPDIHLRVDSGRFLKHTHTHMNPTQKIMEIICSALMYKPIIYGKMGKSPLGSKAKFCGENSTVLKAQTGRGGGGSRRKNNTSGAVSPPFSQAPKPSGATLPSRLPLPPPPFPILRPLLFLFLQGNSQSELDSNLSQTKKNCRLV